MTVRLLPAYRRGGHNPFWTGKPLTEYAALVRSVHSGRGRYEARWHRVRTATQMGPLGDLPSWVAVTAWCGTSVSAREAFTTDDALDGFPCVRLMRGEGDGCWTTRCRRASRRDQDWRHLRA